MKRPILAMFCLLFVSTVATAAPWTHFSVEGEDASSASYYFYRVKGDTVEQVRWVWNGGAQNPPTATDFLLEEKRIVVRHYEGTRKVIEKLITGAEVALTLTKEYAIDTSGDPLAKVVARKSGITEEQRVDLTNLIDLIDHERQPMP